MIMKPAKDLEGTEIVDALRADDLRAKVRSLFLDCWGNIEQAIAQRKPPSTFEVRRMELEAAERIITLIRQPEEIATGNKKGVVTWRGKLVEEMTRDDLASALNECAALYGKELQKAMRKDRSALLQKGEF